jgi:hypothetical protein
MTKAEKVKAVRDIRSHLALLTTSIQNNDSEWIAKSAAVAYFELEQLIKNGLQDDLAKLKLVQPLVKGA